MFGHRRVENKTYMLVHCITYLTLKLVLYSIIVAGTLEFRTAEADKQSASGQNVAVPGFIIAKGLALCFTLYTRASG